MMASEQDPHNVAPDWFFERFDGVVEASRALPAATDRADRTRCPECASTAITPKGSSWGDDAYHRKPGDYRCKSCICHFDEPAPSANTEDVPNHPGCRGGRINVRRRPGDKDFYCHYCCESFDHGGSD